RARALLGLRDQRQLRDQRGQAVTRATAYTHEFIEFIPEELVDGVVYISIEYATASHRCMCGCSSKIVTPLAPNRWAITFDGHTVSLRPSIGNWSYQCKAH